MTLGSLAETRDAQIVESRARRWIARASMLLLGACGPSAGSIDLPPLGPGTDAGKPAFVCKKKSDVTCEGSRYLSCKDTGEFLQVEELDCGAMGEVCDAARGCIACDPGSSRCRPCAADDASCDKNVVEKCDATGDSWGQTDTCSLSNGDVCYEGACHNMCELAGEQRSYVGCEFFAVDLDNAAIDNLHDASRQQYAVAVANPEPIPVDVKVEVNDAALGAPLSERQVSAVTVPPGSLEVLKLPTRQVDGSSDVAPTSGPLDNGTHTALSSAAYRVSSSLPVAAYQFNPLENVNVFSNGASCLFPVSAIGTRYTVNGWPQTIASSDNPDQNFDPTSMDTNLRAFLTIVGSQDGTHVDVTLGSKVVKVVGAGAIPESGPGDQLSLDIGSYDVINLETQGFNADFTGSLVVATQPVTVFVGSEASDVPVFGTYATRQCCADHLEMQLIPDASLGARFSFARSPNRTVALAAAALPDEPLGVAVTNYPEWARVLAVASGDTTVTTTLPSPNDKFLLHQGEDAILRADQDFLLNGDKAISVLQALPSQDVTGIPSRYPGGDPDIFPVPPIEEYRKDYIFLTPDKYSFDFVTILAPVGTNILLDGEPLPSSCTSSPANPASRKLSPSDPDRVVYRCQLSFPNVTSGPNSQVFAGEQHDGAHTILADHEVGIFVNGFDRFVSYGYIGGLNLQVIN